MARLVDLGAVDGFYKDATDQGIRIGLRFVEQRKRSFGQNRILHQLAQWHCASVGPWPYAIAQSEYVLVLLFECEIAC